MKKRLFVSILCILLVVTASLLTACDKLELSAPTNVKYDGATITWNAVENAESYLVVINDGEEHEVTQPSYAYVANGQQFSVTITAVSNLKKLVKSDETRMEFVALPSVTAITVNNDGTISWDGVSGATAYLVRIDQVEYETTNTTYDQIPAGKHNVNVRPIVSGNGSYYSSYLKNNVTLNVCDVVAKNDITYKNGAIYWRGIDGAQCYELKINGQVVSSTLTTTSYSFDANNTNFDVAVKAVGNHSSTYDGKYSEQKSFVFLDTVTNINVEDGVVTWQAIPGADAYKLKLNGVEQSATLSQPKYDELSADVSVDIQIMPISNDSTYFSDWSAVRSVRILPAPVLLWNNSLDLDGEARNSVYWDGIQSAQSYSIRLTKPNGQQVVSTHPESERAFADAYMDVGTYKIEAKCVAGVNETGVYDSVYSRPITVTRLAAPKPVQSNYIVSSATGEYDGFTVTFEKNAAASKYKLYKDNVEHQISESNQFRVTDVADKNSLEMQKVNYKIQSIGSIRTENGETKVVLNSLSANSLAFDITVLATPTQINMSGYIYSFGAVEQNHGYVIDVQGQAYSSDTTQYNMNFLQAGSFEVKVRAKGNGTTTLASNSSAPISITRLAAPTNIRIGTSGQSEGMLTYDGVAHAKGYVVVINNGAQAINSEEVGNMNQYVTVKGTTVYMESTANEFNNDNTVYYMTSRPSETKNFIKLAAPTFGDVAFNGNSQLVWNKPDNINENVYTPTYEVMNAAGISYNGEKNGTAMDISMLDGGQDYVFKVKAIGNGTNYINSDESQPVQIHKLATPSVVKNDGKYEWKGVARANSYVVFVDGVEMDKPIHVAASDTYSFTPRFTEIKSYKVEVVAVGDGGYYTINSNNATITQETKQLITPEFSMSYNAQSFTSGAGIVITITKEAPYASGYSYSVSGATETSADTTYTYTVNNPGEYIARVYALGGAFDENGVYYIDSQSAGGNNSTKITILTTPNPSDWKLSRDGVLSWAAVSNAVRYEIQISVDDGEFVSVTQTQTSYTIVDFSFSSKYTIRITAIGNGTKIITSATVEKTWEASI